MRIVFMGTPDFAVPTLRALVAAGHEVVAAYSQPPRPAGRGKQLQPSAVHRAAEELGIPVRTPLSLKGAEEQAVFAALQADVAVVAAYGLILPQPILDAPRHGCLNVHGSLLPRWRGAAPIQRAIEAGDERTGITIMQMDEGLDTGAMRLIRPLPIGRDDSAASLHDKLAVLGAQAIVEALDLLADGQLPSQPQPAQGVCFAHKIEKSEAALDFTRSAAALDCKIRALDPFPGCTASWKGMLLKVGGSRALSAAQRPQLRGEPGEVVAIEADGPLLATGDGFVQLCALQKPGGKRLPARAFMVGTPIVPGDRFV